MLLNSNFIKRLLLSQRKCSTKVMKSVRTISTTKLQMTDHKTGEIADLGVHKGNYDVIIAGGGMVGFTLACAFAKDKLLSNLNVLLLEGSPNRDININREYSNRVVALNQNTKSFMSKLQVWKHVEDIRLQPVRYMQVWDAYSDAMISFSSAEMLDDDVAYIVENDVLLHAIRYELAATQSPNLNINYNSKIESYKLPKPDEKPSTTVKMSNGDYYTCELLIGADGAKSAVRDAMGVQYVSWDYNQMGVVATLELAEVNILQAPSAPKLKLNFIVLSTFSLGECNNNTAWQRWLPTGPVALLPLNEKYSSLVWSTWQDNAKELLQLPEDQFVDSLNDALWKQYPRNPVVETAMSWMTSALRVAGLSDGTTRQLPPSVCRIVSGSRAAFPLGFGHSTRYIAPGVALIGDAAHRVHPLAGQGVNLGFGDVKELVELLSESVYSGFDLTHNNWMEKYESSRQRHNVPTQMMIEMLHRLYTTEVTPVVLARSLGVQITNALHPLKKIIMSQATT